MKLNDLFLLRLNTNIYKSNNFSISEPCEFSNLIILPYKFYLYSHSHRRGIHPDKCNGSGQECWRMLCHSYMYRLPRRIHRYLTKVLRCNYIRELVLRKKTRNMFIKLKLMESIASRISENESYTWIIKKMQMQQSHKNTAIHLFCRWTSELHQWPQKNCAVNFVRLK